MKVTDLHFRKHLVTNLLKVISWRSQKMTDLNWLMATDLHSRMPMVTKMQKVTHLLMEIYLHLETDWQMARLKPKVKVMRKVMHWRFLMKKD
ncbi:MAG: hypothetical protein PVJ67_04330 [Candidatus Pacearchaeota archaeon]